MSLSSCVRKRRGNGQREAQATSRSPIPWTPRPHGQLESERFIAGDATAASALSSLISHLAVEQAAARPRPRAAGPWSLGCLFFSNASLIGENFQQSVLGVHGRDRARPVRTGRIEPRRGAPCPGHWKLVYCSGQGCCAEHPQHETPQSRPLTTEDVERISNRPDPIPFQAAQRVVSITPSLEQELDARGPGGEEGDEFDFGAYLRDHAEYEQALCEVTAIAARPGSPRLVSLGRGHEAAGARLPQPSRLSLMAPPSGPPSIPLPPSPPSTVTPVVTTF